MEGEYDIKMRGGLGPDVNDDKSIRILNRCLELRRDGVYLEADPRHTEMIIQDLKLMNSNVMSTPAVKVEPEANPTYLDKDAATQYRRIAARCNVLALDKGDIQFAVQQCAKGMSRPTQQNLEQHRDWEGTSVGTLVM